LRCGWASRCFEPLSFNPSIRKPELVLIFCVQGALRSTVTGKSETRRISRWLFAGDVGKRSSRTFKAFSAVLDTCPVPVRGGRRSSLMNNRRQASAACAQVHPQVPANNNLTVTCAFPPFCRASASSLNSSEIDAFLNDDAAPLAGSPPHPRHEPLLLPLRVLLAASFFVFFGGGRVVTLPQRMLQSTPRWQRRD